MKNIFCTGALVVLFQFAFGQEDPQSYVPGEVLIQVDQASSLTEIINTLQFVNNEFSGLRISREVSRPVHIWLLAFDENNVSHADMIAALYTNEHVLIAQNNHYVQERATTPNDPSLGNQWHHVNTNDSDIDSDLAWDITTGGSTAFGDQIVVCVIEGGGSDYSHPDLIANHWINTAEIDGNLTDDDGNGYVDDYYGWNSGAGTDNIATGSHGTGVTGMIGAVGDNNNNVVGANWDVKIMQVDMAGTLSEANVIAAYTYPLVMRELYTSSGGTQGAFVVATNASWGIDNANPASYPLWCNFYDTLGVAGILNCGATANNNVNIDVVGDMPTACASPYMISVTATNNTDVRTFSGYGQTTIDLGAPGSAVYTTSNGGGNGSTSGTSFASPLTAGVIGLIYSHPCSDIGLMALSDPQGAADLVRQALLDGVDPVSNLTTETVTGGRLNAFNSVQMIAVLSPLTFSGTTSSTVESSGNDGTIDLTVTGGNAPFTFAWTGPGAFTAATEDITGLATGNYNVTVTDVNGCEFTLTNVNVGSAAGINDIGAGYSIYPNPAQKEFTLTLNPGESVQFVVYDAAGKIVLSQTAAKTTTFGVTGIAPGIYVYTVTNQSGARSTGKLVIE